MTLFERQGLTVDEATLVFNTRGRPADGQLTVLLHSNTKRERQVPTDFPSSPTVAPQNYRSEDGVAPLTHTLQGSTLWPEPVKGREPQHIQREASSWPQISQYISVVITAILHREKHLVKSGVYLEAHM